jgi:alpha-beta hydrolase superfamily lysophospholipase
VLVSVPGVVFGISGALAAGTGAPLPPLRDHCGSDPSGGKAQVFRFPAADGTSLDGALLGSSGPGVVLAHESPADLCGWLPYAAVLERAGFRVLLFDFRGYGLSERGRTGDYVADVRGAARELRRRGATKVFLVGASFGGAAVLTAGAEMSDVAGIVSLSGETDLPGSDLHALRAAPRLRAPLLVMTSTTDRYLSVRQAKALVRAAGSKQKRVVVYPGSFHGWDLLYVAPYKAKASATLIGFLRAQARS